jgi:hypothetical protein
MAKKGERVGAMGDTVYYRTPDGQIIDDAGNVLKGPMAKMLADEYESKQQEKAKAQAEAKAAAEEDKRKKAAEKSAEIARKAAERQAASDAKRQQADEERAQKAAEREAARQQQKPQAPRQQQSSTPRQAAPKQQSAPPASEPTAGQTIVNTFKKAAMSAGQTAFNSAFPTLSGAINNKKPRDIEESSVNSGDSRQVLNRVADEVNTTNMMMQTSIARQEMTNQILLEILKEVQQVKKPSLLDTAADALSNLGGANKAKAAKVTPKSGMLGAAGSALKRAPIIGALLGGGIEGYEEYQESGNATRAVSTGAGAAAGGGLGAWGGASAGAALGAFGGPVGMAIGGLLGAIGGGIGGSWLGGKAGKGAYDMLATPSAGPGASGDIRAAQATRVENNNDRGPLDSVVNVKNLVFNAEKITFNSKDQKPNETPAAGGGAAAAAAPEATVQAATAPAAAGAIPAAGAQQNTADATPAAQAQQQGQSQQHILATGIETGISASKQQELFQKGVGNGGTVQGVGHQDVQGIKNAILKNPNAKVTLYSASARHAEEIVKFMKVNNIPLSNLNILQPHNSADAKIKKAIELGLPAGNVNVGMGAAVGGNLAGIAGVKQENVGHFQSLEKLGKNFQDQTPPTSQMGTGTEQVQAARQNAGTASFFAGAQARPAQGAMAAGAQTASLGNPNEIKSSAAATAVKLASAMVGKTRVQSLDYLKAGGYNNQGEHWCSEFVSSSLKQAGMPIASGNSKVANAYQTYGTAVDPSKVQAGDVVLQTNGGRAGQTGGHVGLATGVYQHGQVEMIAGNSRGQVRKYMVPVNAQLMVRRGGGTQLAGADPKNADPTVGGTPGAVKPSSGATAASLTPKETQALQTASLQSAAGPTKGAELSQASTKDMADQRTAKTGITVNQQNNPTPAIDNSNKGKNDTNNVGIVEPVDARTRLKELFGIA